MLVYQTKYRSQSAQFKLFRSISVRSHSQRKTSIFIRISEFFSGRFTAAKIRRRIRLAEFFFGWYSADINSAANSDIRLRLGGLFCSSCWNKYCYMTSLNVFDYFDATLLSLASLIWAMKYENSLKTYNSCVATEWRQLSPLIENWQG